MIEGDGPPRWSDDDVAPGYKVLGWAILLVLLAPVLLIVWFVAGFTIASWN